MSHSPAAAAVRPVNKVGTLIAMCLGLMVAQIDTSVVNLALPAIAHDLDAGVGALQWVVDAYNLVYGGLLLTGGTLGDLYGRKRIFLIGIALFCAGSILCAFAPDPNALIAGRIVAGLGAALELPATLAILSVAYTDPAERARAIGIWAGVNGLAFVIGPTIGGLLVEGIGWRSIFWIVIPFGIAALVLGAGSVTESAGKRDRRLDPIGQVLMIAGLSAFTLAAIDGRAWGWQSWPTLGCALAGVAAVAGFVAVARRSETGLVPLSLFRLPRFSGALTVTAAMTFGMYGMLFIIPTYLQTVRSASPFDAGIEMLPMSAIFFAVSRYSGWMTGKITVRGMMVAGMACMGSGVLALSTTALGDSLPWVEIWLTLIGIGLGLNTGPVLGLVVGSVPAERAGTASGLANTSRLTGATLGVAILGTLLASGIGAAAPTGAHFLAGMSAAFRPGGIILLLGGVVAAVTARQPRGRPVA